MLSLDADLMQKILLLLFVIVLLSRICCLMQTLCGVICFIYTDKVDLSYVSRGKLLCCVNPVARESKAHNRDGGHDYRSNAHRTEEV